MADAAAVQQLRTSVLCHMNIAGRIEAVRTYDGSTYTKVICPAKDAFSKPSVFEVRSDRKFGDIGSEFTTKTVSVSGYIRDYTYEDKKTKEIKDGQEHKVFFELAE